MKDWLLISQIMRVGQKLAIHELGSIYSLNSWPKSVNVFKMYFVELDMN